jgi:hypothetical protein
MSRLPSALTSSKKMESSADEVILKIYGAGERGRGGVVCGINEDAAEYIEAMTNCKPRQLSGRSSRATCQYRV